MDRRKALLDAIENLEHREDGIPSIPKDTNYSSVLNEGIKGFRSYINRENQSDDVIFVIGCDFGTSATKIVIQQAYGAAGQSVALPVPEPFRLDKHPHCWKTLLFYNERKCSFSLLNEENSREIRNIKTTVMGKSNETIFQDGDEKFTYDHAAVAYLGLMIRYAKGWLYANGRRFFGIDLQSYNINWQVNMGLPASSIDDKRLSNRFHDILNAAYLISETDEPASIKLVINCLSLVENNTSNFEGKTSLRPEVTAESACLIQFGLLDFKTYALIDIGSSTLDVCVFNYFNTGDNEKKQALLVADVKLLGVQAIDWIKTLDEYNGVKFSEDELKGAIRSTIGNALIEAKKSKAPDSSVWTGGETFEILLAGGGAYSTLHRTEIKHYVSIFSSQTQAKDIEVKNPPSNFEHFKHWADDNNAHRLAVAWGLSILDEEFIKFDPPSKASDIVFEKVDQFDFISKDQV